MGFKVRGTKRISKTVDIEIDRDEIVRIINMLMRISYPTFRSDNYVSDGTLYVYDGDDHHNGNPTYIRQPATAIDIECYLLYSHIQTLLINYSRTGDHT